MAARGARAAGSDAGSWLPWQHVARVYAHVVCARTGKVWAEAGYVEGRDVAIDFRWAESQYEGLPALAGELVDRRVNVIAAGALPAAVAAKAATTTIPIVFSIGVDPVAFGLVASLNRPGGNMTGVTNLNLELGSKQLEVLRELLPAATSMAALIQPDQSQCRRALKRSAGGRAQAGDRAPHPAR